MSAEKRNNYFDAPDDSDADLERGYDSEAHEESRGGRAAKRRKVEHKNSSDGEDDFQDALEHVEHSPTRGTSPSTGTATGPGLHSDEADHATFSGPPRSLHPASFKPRAIKVATTRDPHLPPPNSKPGILYLSRIPPFLKPSSLRSLLSPHAPKHGLGRIFLTPEDPEVHKQRKRSGGNKKRSFVDGWVEFVSKREAKAVAEGLNARPIGGRGWYASDVWCLKYLRGFKWSDLVETVRAEKSERDARMRAEIGMATRENKLFVAAVEKAKVERTKEERRRRRREKEVDETGEGEEVQEERVAERAGDGKKLFKQHRVHDKETRGKVGKKRERDPQQPEQHPVLGSIFG